MICSCDHSHSCSSKESHSVVVVDLLNLQNAGDDHDRVLWVVRYPRAVMRSLENLLSSQKSLFLSFQICMHARTRAKKRYIKYNVCRNQNGITSFQRVFSVQGSRQVQQRPFHVTPHSIVFVVNKVEKSQSSWEATYVGKPGACAPCECHASEFPM